MVWLVVVTDPLFPLGDGGTLLSEEDRQGLIPSYVATRGDLIDAEQRNIAQALLRRKPTPARLLDDHYLRSLHKAMFDQVWEWAGRYRLKETNIGIDPADIPVAVRALVDDARAWVKYQTYAPDELAVRFHHRLVAVHPFPNGNGRHGRIAADYLVSGLDRPPFGWGANLDVGTDELRAVYRMPYSKRTMARSPTCSPSHALDPPRVASRSATPWTASTPTDSTDRYQDLEHSGAQGPGTSPYRALSLRPPRLFRRFPLSPLERGEGAPLKYRPASDRR